MILILDKQIVANANSGTSSLEAQVSWDLGSFSVFKEQILLWWKIDLASESRLSSPSVFNFLFHCWSVILFTFFLIQKQAVKNWDTRFIDWWLSNLNRISTVDWRLVWLHRVTAELLSEIHQMQVQPLQSMTNSRESIWRETVLKSQARLAKKAFQPSQLSKAISMPITITISMPLCEGLNLN